MKLNEHLRKARLVKELSENELAQRSGLSIYEIGDIEARADEFLTAITSRNALNLCKELSIDACNLLELMPESGLFNDEPKVYLQKIRKISNISSLELDDLIGYEPGFVKKLESGLLDLMDYPLEVAMTIANKTKSSRGSMIRILENDLSCVTHNPANRFSPAG